MTGYGWYKTCHSSFLLLPYCLVILVMVYDTSEAVVVVTIVINMDLASALISRIRCLDLGLICI